jgi:hypothetical protein
MHRANMLGAKSPAMERVTNSDPSHISDKVAEAMKRVSVVISHLDQIAGRQAREQVVNLCMSDHPLPDAGKAKDMADALRRAMDG